jgi:hypothetical protein
MSCDIVDSGTAFAAVAAFAAGAARKSDAVKTGRGRSLAIRRDKKATIEFGSSIQQWVANASISQSDAHQRLCHKVPVQGITMACALSASCAVISYAAA